MPAKFAKEEFARRLAARFGGCLVVRGSYFGITDTVWVACVECGMNWMPIANGLLRGVGCPHCNPRPGFDPTKPSLLYGFSFANAYGRRLYKIGITNHRDPRRRYGARDRRAMTLLHTIGYATGAEARAAERHILTNWSDLRFWGEKGLSFSNTEVFVVDVLDEQTMLRVLAERHRRSVAPDHLFAGAA
jgi:hypothetical protein